MDPESSAGISQHLDYAELAWANGDPASALAGVSELLGPGTPGLSPDLERRARRVRALALEGVGDYAGAIAELESLVAEAARDEQWIGLEMALNRCYRESGDSARAITAGRDAIAEVERLGLGDTEEAIRLTVTVAGAYVEAGDRRHALRLCEQAAERARAIGSQVGLASAYWNASTCHDLLGDSASALDLASQALATFEAVGNARAEGLLHVNVAHFHLRLNPPDLDAAERHATRAVSVSTWSDASAVERAKALHIVAKVAYARGDLDAARGAATQTLGIADPSGPSLAAGCQLLLGRISLAEGQRDDARLHFEQAVLWLASCGQDLEIAQAWFELGGLLREVGDTHGAIDAYRRAGVTQGLVIPQSLSV